jgi:SAM-dependent methyltransferase
VLLGTCGASLQPLAAQATPAQAARSQTAPEADNPSYAGRPIAGVMGYQGAPWLEREEREAEERTDLLLELLPIEAGDLVADLGCGSGYFARRLAARVGDAGTVLCIDIQPEMLDIAKRLALGEGITNIEYVLADEDDSHLPAGSVDLILMVDVYHELQAPAPLLAQMRRALDPAGRVALVEYRAEGDSARHIRAEHRMSVEQVRREWEPAGFEVAQLIEELPTQHLFLLRRNTDAQH